MSMRRKSAAGGGRAVLHESASSGLTDALAELDDAIENYHTRFYGPLTDESDAAGAYHAIAEIHGKALPLQTMWEDLVRAAPDADEVTSAVDIDWRGRLFQRDRPAKELSNRVFALLPRLNVPTGIGYQILRLIGKAFPYALHFERECAALDPSGSRVDEYRENAAGMRGDLGALRERLEVDVSAQRAQIEIMSIYLQMALGHRVHHLTRTIVILTGVLLVLAATTAAIGIYGVFFGSGG